MDGQTQLNYSIVLIPKQVCYRYDFVLKQILYLGKDSKRDRCPSISIIGAIRDIVR